MWPYNVRANPCDLSTYYRLIHKITHTSKLPIKQQNQTDIPEAPSTFTCFSIPNWIHCLLLL